MTDKMGPQDFSDALFNALQDVSGTSLVVRPPEEPFPWVGYPGGEDHAMAEDAIRRIYERLKLKPPHWAWAPSPASMYMAINMLRAIQSGQRHKFIEGLVLANDPVAHAKRTLLDAIIDRTVTTTTGQAIKPLLGWRSREKMWMSDLLRFLGAHNFRTQNAGPKPLPGPNVNEVTVYPDNYLECIGPLVQILSFIPYVHICWICRPPIEARLYEDGHLQMMRFSDGYEISLPPAEEPKELEEAEELKGLPEGIVTDTE